MSLDSMEASPSPRGAGGALTDAQCHTDLCGVSDLCVVVLRIQRMKSGTMWQGFQEGVLF